MPAPVPGAEGFKMVVGAFLNAFPDFHVVVEDVIGEGDLFSSRGYFTGTHQGDFQGIAATGKKINAACIDIWRIEDGKLVENWVNLDMMGTMPWLVPPDEPFVRAMSRLFGAPLVPTHRPQHNASPLVRGQAASPGKVRGRARLIHTLEEAKRLQRGDILVTVAMMPPWTPLLAIAGAVVTDVGGILSHAAIIAREYRIPAVVATRVATEIIQDEQLIEVDGAAGVVYILA